MKVQMSDGAVPFVISYRRILRKPKITRERKFVGARQLIRNAFLKVIELIDDLAYETETTVQDPGKSVVVHWAVNIEDPWDIAPGREANLVAFRMLGDKPPCGAHFEIITPPKKNEQRQEQEDRHEITPEEFRGRSSNSFRRPPDVAYAPRKVRTIDEEVVGQPTNGVSLVAEDDQ